LAAVAANTLVRPHPPSPAERDLAAARAALQDTHGRPELAVSLADKALAFAGDSPPHQAEAHFLLGLATARLAGHRPAEQAPELLKAALAHLAQAEALGVAEEDQPSLWYGLGRLTYLTGGDMARAVEYLGRGLPQGADNPAEGYGLLAQAYLRLPAPNLEAALQANQRQLDYGRGDRALASARLIRGEILFRLEKFADAVKVLERVSPTAPPEVRQRADFLLAQSAEKAGLWGKAGPLWEKLLQAPGQVPGGKARVLYNLGVCRLPTDAGAARTAWQQAAAEGGEEGQAAALRLAELDLALPAPDVAGAEVQLRRAVEKLAGPADYQNRLVDLEKARDLFEAALRAALDAQDFERAQRLADLYGKVAAPGTAEERGAAAAEALARQTAEKARHARPGAEAAALREQARAQWRAAAHAAERAARARGDDQADGLWRAAQGYRNGGANEEAVAVLERLVQMTLPAGRQAEAWFTLAEALRELGRTDEAHKAYLECTNYSASAFSYRARYQLALQSLEQGRKEEAEAVLVQNLQIINPQVDKAAYQLSLYKLAGLLFQEHKYDDAWLRLNQAADEFPDHPDALAVRDQLGECCRELARQEEKRLARLLDPASRGVADRADKQAHYERKRREWLDQAAGVYQKLKEDLQQATLSRVLSDEEFRLLRRAAFSLAEVELERNQFSESLRLYLDLVREYRSQFESVVALTGVNKCWNQMLNSAPDQARELRDRVKAAVKQVSDDVKRDVIAASAFPADQPRDTIVAWLDSFTAFLEQGEPLQRTDP
jgi:tetratricopeptide (TPR) repeat protein